MPIFLERFLLAICAAAVVTIVLIDTMRLDLTQRITLGLAILFFAYFVAHTAHKSNQSKPADASTPTTRDDIKQPEQFTPSKTPQLPVTTPASPAPVLSSPSPVPRASKPRKKQPTAAELEERQRIDQDLNYKKPE